MSLKSKKERFSFTVACVGLLFSGMVLHTMSRGHEPPFWAALALLFGIAVTSGSLISGMVIDTMSAWTRGHDESAD